MGSLPGKSVAMFTIRSGFSIGNDRSLIASSKLNTVVFAPIPRREKAPRPSKPGVPACECRNESLTGSPFRPHKTNLILIADF